MTVLPAVAVTFTAFAGAGAAFLALLRAADFFVAGAFFFAAFLALVVFPFSKVVVWLLNEPASNQAF